MTRQRLLGTITRGTTAPHRLRRVDSWIISHLGDQLRVDSNPLIVDLGFGASGVTTVELSDRLTRAIGRRVHILGLEIDPSRVEVARHLPHPSWVDFGLGGFELAGANPLLVRAMNVLRQYDESHVAAAWAAMTTSVRSGGTVIEGTCDESGRVATWVALDSTGPRSLTFSADLATLRSPLVFAQRLPKILIHHNIPGEKVHTLLTALDCAWAAASAYAVFSPHQRWVRTVSSLREAGWPVIASPARWRRGEMTIRWSAL